MQVQSLGWEDPLEKGMVTHSSILAWRIPWTEESDGLQPIGLQGVGHFWNDLASMHEWWQRRINGIKTKTHVHGTSKLQYIDVKCWEREVLIYGLWNIRKEGREKGRQEERSEGEKWVQNPEHLGGMPAKRRRRRNETSKAPSQMKRL